MPIAIRQILLLIGKDLRIEARSRQTLGLVVTLGLLVVVVLGLGLGPEQARGFSAIAVLWVAYLFSGVLCFEKTMSIERHEGAMAGLLLAPVDRGVLYLSKLIANLLMMFAVALVITPAGVLLFSFDLSAAPGSFIIVMSLAMVGVAAVGTLFAAVVSSTRLAGGLLAMVVFPITLPVVIASTQLLLGVFRDGRELGGSGLAVLVAFDVIFVIVSWLVFEWILEP